jgi:hypothetical protein
MSDDASFLGRWSRLKRRVTIERETSPKSPAAAEPPAPPVSAPAARSEEPQDIPPVASSGSVKPAEAEEPVDLSKLPSIDSLGKDSDYSMFMRQGVPEDLRMKALRRMWLTDPVLAGPEVLDMYAWDYTGVDGHKPLVRPAMEAVAAVAKGVKDAIKEAEAQAPDAQAPGASAPKPAPDPAALQQAQSQDDPEAPPRSG